MQTTFSIALVASVSFASSQIKDAEIEFIGFAGTYNKDYKNTEEMADRIGIYLGNKQKVQGMQAHNSDAKFGLNSTADMTDEEYLATLGAIPTSEDQQDNFQPDNSSGGRLLQDSSYYIDWRDTKYLGDVKRQGGCGSCWAFAATTVQEAMQAIQDDKEPIRLSEQEGVDCDERSYGCKGGWMSSYWKMTQEIGAQSNEDYPYETKTLECRNQGEDKVIQSKMLSHGQIAHTGDQTEIDLIKEKLQEGPLSVAVSAGSGCWRWYESGILSAKDECNTSIDHGVSLVGLAQSDEGQEYWIVQNSWGTSFGEDGFIRLAVETGYGVSCINCYPLYMTVDPAFPEEQEEEEEEQELPEKCDVIETLTPEGNSTCVDDSQCQGLRECNSEGLCLGKSYCDGTPIPDQCSINEKKNELGPRRCYQSTECKGARNCDEFGYCRGRNECPKKNQD